MSDLPRGRMIVMAVLAVMLSACAGVAAGQTRLSEARALAQQWAEVQVDATFESLLGLGVMGDIDCSAETGVDAKQCFAFLARMTSEIANLRDAERPQALAEAAPEIEGLARAIASLSDTDIAAYRDNVTPPLWKIFKPLTEAGQQTIAPADEALRRALAEMDQKVVDQMDALISEVLVELMADPSLNSP